MNFLSVEHSELDRKYAPTGNMRKRSRVVSKGFKIVFGFQINHSKLLCGLLLLI